jgi:hypothetical protein
MRPIKRRNSQGQTFIEFLFVMLWAVPFLLITLALGMNLIEGLEVIQLARDTASMYARKVDFTTDASKDMLDRIGNGLNLKTQDATNSQATVVMSALTFMDTNACNTATANGCSCGNAGQWVFAQYLILPPPGSSSPASQSQYGNPASATNLADSKGVIQLCNSTNHSLSYASNAAAVATGFAARGITSWASPPGFGLPSGQLVYLVEVTANGYSVPGLVDPAPGHTNSLIYNYAIF